VPRRRGEAELGESRRQIGEVSAVTEASFRVTAQGGAIEVLRARGADGKKVSGGDFAKANGLAAGAILGN
jgi:methionyl-tRNA formyltransferase